MTNFVPARKVLLPETFAMVIGSDWALMWGKVLLLKRLVEEGDSVRLSTGETIKMTFRCWQCFCPKTHRVHYFKPTSLLSIDGNMLTNSERQAYIALLNNKDKN